jgi:ubiquinone/menaquinone biosynthesis C-methylase UbiE
MTTGGIIEITLDPDGKELYHLPAEHAACLTRQAGSNNLAVYSQEIPLLTSLVMDSIVEAFKSGEGLAYDCYPRFQTFMTELANQKHRRLLVEEFLPSVRDGRLVDQLNQGIEVCDLGCGEGIALLLMAQTFPQSNFTGIDISSEALDAARSKSSEAQLANIAFIQRDAGRLYEDQGMLNRFDYITAFDAIHDQTEPQHALQGVYHLLKPDGFFSMIDIAAESGHIGNLDHPMGPFLYTVSLLHCMPVGLYNRGEGLGMMWGRQQAVSMLNAAGFKEVEVMEMAFDPFNYHYLAHK